MERINVRIDDQTKRQIEAEASERGVKPSDIVRVALAEHLKSRKTPPNARQLAQELGILGSAKGLPADLSTNPKYMDGFGE